MKRRTSTRFGRDSSGASAVEFALVIPAFILLVFGGMGAATLGFTVVSLHSAVQDAARCAAVKTTVCTNASTTQAYAASRYSGPNISPTFVYTTTACGPTVTATATYDLNIIPQISEVPITASACYPVEATGS
jgi:Flp pilus assembly protein TadG